MHNCNDENKISRRNFFISSSAAFAALSVASAGHTHPVNKQLTAGELNSYLNSLGIDWINKERTVDTFKSGSPDTVVKGIAVGWMSYSSALKRALELGLSNPAGEAYANQLLGQYSLGSGKLDEAIDYYERGIRAAQEANRPAVTAHLHYLRAVAYRRRGRYHEAYEDIQKALVLARGSGEGQAYSLYEGELATIEHHSGRSLGPPPTRNIR